MMAPVCGCTDTSTSSPFFRLNCSTTSRGSVTAREDPVCTILRVMSVDGLELELVEKKSASAPIGLRDLLVQRRGSGCSQCLIREDLRRRDRQERQAADRD